MSGPQGSGGHSGPALVRELFTAAMEKNPRTIFEQRALIKRALQEIGIWRANRDFDPVFDGDHGALKIVEQVHRAITSKQDHHIRAAMLVAAELDMLQPSPVSQLGQALHQRTKGTATSKGDETRGADPRHR